MKTLVRVQTGSDSGLYPTLGLQTVRRSFISLRPTSLYSITPKYTIHRGEFAMPQHIVRIRVIGLPILYRLKRPLLLEGPPVKIL